MESPDYASSPESAPKRSLLRSRSPGGADDKEKQTHIRFLVSNTAAGSIIGKGGSTINEFQSESGARIQLSRNHEVFPGTSDRIIMISGAYNEIIKALEMILSKLLNEAEENNELKTSLVVPNSSCGAIIGKGGANIKSLIEDSGAHIKISPQDHNYVASNDRLVTVMGDVEEQLRAINLIMEKLTEDAHYPHSLNSAFPYAGAGFPGGPSGFVIPSESYNTMNYGRSGMGGGQYPISKGTGSQVASVRSPAVPNDGRGKSVSIGIADEHIGAVVGRGGRNIMEISQVSGARIKISDRGDFMPGTSDRKVTMTGTPEAIRTAEAMIMQKVAENSER